MSLDRLEIDAVLEATRRWISQVVIGLNLCPFASRVFNGELIRYVVSEAANEEELTDQFGEELRFLSRMSAIEVETTLLILPRVFADFQEFNDYLPLADLLIAAMGLEGVIQIASFHPQYQFEGTRPDDVENFTNRSPCPMLHLLREESIARVSVEGSDPLEIPRRNIELLRRLGREKLLEISAQPD